MLSGKEYRLRHMKWERLVELQGQRGRVSELQSGTGHVWKIKNSLISIPDGPTSLHSLHGGGIVSCFEFNGPSWDGGAFAVRNLTLTLDILILLPQVLENVKEVSPSIASVLFSPPSEDRPNSTQRYGCALERERYCTDVLL